MKHRTNARALILVLALAGTSLFDLGCATTRDKSPPPSGETPVEKAEKKARRFEKFADPERHAASDAADSTGEKRQ